MCPPQFHLYLHRVYGLPHSLRVEYVAIAKPRSILPFLGRDKINSSCFSYDACSVRLQQPRQVRRLSWQLQKPLCRDLFNTVTSIQSSTYHTDLGSHASFPVDITNMLRARAIPYGKVGACDCKYDMNSHPNPLHLELKVSGVGQPRYQANYQPRYLPSTINRPTAKHRI